MKQKLNRRIFKPQIEINSSLTYKELKQMLAAEQRKDNQDLIKDILFNKLFARVVFAVCIGLNLIFIILGVLNYLEILG
ncbi:MAG TPA: hypothetical protein DCL21_02645 [Alphaproteobacteria bacterium]|nr:hypothetical protein [Alphaproteobacteria bacterium]